MCIFLMNHFIWKEVSEKEREEIRKQAKDIMDKFSEKISEIDLSDFEDKGGVRRDDFERKEKLNSSVSDESFSRDIMFQNAHRKNKDFILGEKKKW